MCNQPYTSKSFASLQPDAFSALWQGTLNEALGESVTLRGDGSYIVYAVYKS